MISCGLDGKYFGHLWNKYRADPDAVAPDWRNAFDFIRFVYGDPYSGSSAGADISPAVELHDYLQRFGHLHGQLDPLELAPRVPLPAGLHTSASKASALVATYASSLTVETGHLDDPAMRDWVVSAFEDIQAAPVADDPAILHQLIETQMFDRFMATKYPGKKRFGSEGADAVLPLLQALRSEAVKHGVNELAIASMHRGRLSIMHNFAGMDAARLFALFGGEHPFPDQTDLPADVPYHFGHAEVRDGISIVLLPNPSHLEAVNPVATGYARARRAQGANTMAVILHTDASVIGQGVNAELLQMSALRSFAVGGTVHIVINNQVGFTTSPEEARSSRYCTGPWRAVDSLLLHVNGNDIDAVRRAVDLAIRFRARFHRDAVIDLVCYRANGHNEIDEPRFTQPLYYRAVDGRRSPIDLYEDQLVGRGVVSAADVELHRRAIAARLEMAFAVDPKPLPPAPAVREREILPALDEVDLREIVTCLARVPRGKGMPKMIKLMERRLEEVSGGISWPLAEAMAIGAVIRAGRSVRISGQDVERGPFSQRHLAAIDPETGQRSQPIGSLARDGATVEIVNSPLSEYAVLGFEYGYSLAATRTLCIWEAQFGDFANGAQIIIDQFIASGHEKWLQTSNLVILLPHGLEGQGPEHSSARIERLLQLCARDNIKVAHPSTPANYFHLLRDQASTGDRPLFILTPKVLLRLPQARSALEEFAGEGRLRAILPSIPDGAVRVVLCSGKIAYEVEKRRDAAELAVGIVRLEMLYPFPRDALAELLRTVCPSEMVWLQEEPENFGAGLWLRQPLDELATTAGINLLPMVARPASASPAGSFHTWHVRDQESLVARALGIEDDERR